MYFLSMLTTTLQNIPPILIKSFGIAIGIIAIGFIIAFHELGHFSFAKLFNIKAPSFSIGFGPTLISKRIGETTFSLSAIPAGGYVEIADRADESSPQEPNPSKSHYFATRPYWQKLLVMLGGIAFNLFLAYALFVLLFATGIPDSKYLYSINGTSVIEKTANDSAAEKAGLLKDDIITAINGEHVQDNLPLLLKILQEKPNQTITLTILRNAEKINIPVTLKEINNRGILGVTFKSAELPKKPFFTALEESITFTNKAIVDTVNGYLNFLTMRSSGGTTGPVGIVSGLVTEYANGFKHLLVLIAIISINLAILNLIPLPILDGGQIVFCTIEAIIGRELPLKAKEYIHITSWILVLGILLYASYNDIAAIIKSFITKNN